MLMVDIRELKIINFAQLSLDIYDDPEYVDLKSRYSTNWSRVCFKSNPISGFFAALYVNKSTNIGVVSLRGTSNTPDKIADIKFVVYRGVQEQYSEIKDYINFLKTLLFKEYIYSLKIIKITYMPSNKNILIFLGCLLLFLILFPIVVVLSIPENVHLNNYLARSLDYIPCLPLGIFFTVWIFRIIKKSLS